MADEKEKKVVSKEEPKKTTEKKETKTAEVKEEKEVKAEAKKTTAKKTTAKAETKKPAAKKTETAKAAKKEEKASEELTATATVKFARISSRKIAIVANLIRGKNVDEALAILQFTPKAGAEVLLKLLNSAIANAENNNNMTHNKLYIAEIYSNQGPTLKRIRPAAKGSAVRIRKRTSNTTIVLKERD